MKVKVNCLFIYNTFLKNFIKLLQFALGLCFYPEFGVLVQSSGKGPGRNLARNSCSEFGKRIWTNPGSAGSKFGERNVPNLGSAGLEFEKRQG